MLRNACALSIMFCLLLCFVAPATVFSQPSKPLRLAVHPFLSASEIQVRFQPLCDYLTQQIGQDVQLFIVKDYQQLINAMGTGQVDLAFMGPSPYVSLTERYGPMPLLGCLVGEQKTYSGVLFVREGSPIKQVTQLKGKRIAFVDPESTMGFQTALFCLNDNGLHLNDFDFKFLGNHHNVVYSVLMDNFDAGAVKPEVYKAFASQGLRVLSRTLDVTDHPFVAAKHLGQTQVDQLRQALFSLTDFPEGKAILSRIRPMTVAIVPVCDREYDSLRTIYPVVEQQREALDGTN